MEIRQLRYFVAAADFSSFTRAAEHCQVSQPSLSQQIAKLELEFGQPLFDRLSRSVVLTDAGGLLLEQARQILTLADAAKDQIDESAAQGKGRVAIAAIPTIAPYLLPKILKHFRQVCPHATVEIQEKTTDLCLEMCTNGKVDLALAALPIDSDDFHLEPLLEDKLLVGLPAKHPLAKKKQLKLQDLKTEPFILLDEAHCLTGSVLSFCQRKEMKPIVNCRSSQLQTVQSLIGLGHGISLIPSMATSVGKSCDIVYRPVVGKPTRTIALLWHRQRFRSRLARQLIETIKTCCSDG